MTYPVLRPLGAALLFFSLAACGNPNSAEATPSAPILGVDLGGARGTTNAIHRPGGPPRGQARTFLAHAGHTQAQGTGTLNAVDANARTINISHGPVAGLGWPAMTMDFPVAPDLDLKVLKPGTRINFTIEHADGDRYIILSVTPASGSGK